MSLLEAHGITKSFGDTTVLHSLDLSVEKGSVTALIGPSGSGKTTLLRSLNALEIPEKGTVRIGEVEVDYGEAVKSRQLRSLRAQSGMVFQSHHLFPHRTVLENITEGPIHAWGVPKDEAVSAARSLLGQVGLSGLEERFPRELSGGQQQRVGIARALALRPHLLLFDEPTSALDPETVGEVLIVMRELAATGWTMVVVTHEIAFAKDVADQVLFLDKGTIVERGFAADVLTHPQELRTQQFLSRILNPLNAAPLLD